MKKLVIGLIIGFALAATIGLAEQATEKRGMGGMHGMMDEQSPGMVEGMKEMMARMSKMMDQCSRMMGGMGGMMGNKPEAKKEDPKNKPTP
jgi:hypothetical protein